MLRCIHTHNYMYYMDAASACYGRQNMGDLVAGASDQIWYAKRACGTKYRVKCIGGVNNVPRPCNVGASVVVTIVDYCSQCNGTINLSQTAFSSIANTRAGKVKVQFVR